VERRGLRCGRRREDGSEKEGGKEIVRRRREEIRRRSRTLGGAPGFGLWTTRKAK